MKDDKEKLNPVSQVVKDLDLISNDTDKKRKRVVKEIRHELAEIKNVKRKRRSSTGVVRK